MPTTHSNSNQTSFYKKAQIAVPTRGPITGTSTRTGIPTTAYNQNRSVGISTKEPQPYLVLQQSSAFGGNVVSTCTLGIRLPNARNPDSSKNRTSTGSDFGS
jgi:hypothetical protein